MIESANVVGAGPNGLAASIRLAQAGVRVTVYEAGGSIGGGARTKELTLPGFHHDVCSAIHPLGAGSPFLRSLPLAEHGLEWIQPEFALAHPFDDGTAAVVSQSLDETARGLGDDGAAYHRLYQPFAENWDRLAGGILGPLIRLPKSPLLMARFGMHARRSAAGLARSTFKTDRARALFTGIAAHANTQLTSPLTASFGLVLGSAAHAAGWPLPRGGSQSIANAMGAYLEQLGGKVVTAQRIGAIDELDASDVVLLDLTPRQAVAIAGTRLSESDRRKMNRFRYGAGVFKVDFALDGPVPWRAAECCRAGTLHLGGSMEEIVASEAATAKGHAPEAPYVLVAQQSLFDDSRAPSGKHTLWAYCHVPAGSTEDMTQRIETQIERFAPGFSKLVLARHVMLPGDLEAYNENYVGGDIAGGAHDAVQLLFRPRPSLSPYSTSDPRVFLCSASTPPGAGVHGMCGFHAARAALGAKSSRR